jgi:hypothetical protein
MRPVRSAITSRCSAPADGHPPRHPENPGFAGHEGCGFAHPTRNPCFPQRAEWMEMYSLGQTGASSTIAELVLGAPGIPPGSANPTELGHQLGPVPHILRFSVCWLATLTKGIGQSQQDESTRLRATFPAKRGCRLRQLVKRSPAQSIDAPSSIVYNLPIPSA